MKNNETTFMELVDYFETKGNLIPFVKQPNWIAIKLPPQDLRINSLYNAVLRVCQVLGAGEWNNEGREPFDDEGEYMTVRKEVIYHLGNLLFMVNRFRIFKKCHLTGHTYVAVDIAYLREKKEGHAVRILQSMGWRPFGDGCMMINTDAYEPRETDNDDEE